MKKGLIVMLVLFVAAAATARTWTNKEGKTLEADLVRVKDGKAYLKLAKNRQIHPLAIDQLSDADQRFIDEHLKAEAAANAAAARADRKAKWHDNFADAKAEAEEFGLPILFLYTAPEWCGYCVRLEENVLETRRFKEFANQNLVLLIADFSNEGDKEDWLEDHSSLAAKFKIGGYPSAYFITANQDKLGRLGGYDANWSAEAYIQKISDIINK